MKGSKEPFFNGGIMRLEELRSEIDQIDRQIADLLDQRFAVVKEVGATKKKENIAVLDSSREARVLEKIDTYNVKEANAIKEVYQKIMDVAKELQ